MPVITRRLVPWTPPPFRPSPPGRRSSIPRGSGPEEGGDPTLIGRITVMVRPAGQITVGTPVTFTAVRTGGGAPLEGYQWSGPAGLIPGATSNSYTFTPTSTADSGTYTVAVTSAGATDSPASGGAAIVVNPAPSLGDRILMEGGSGFILLEAGAGYILQEN